MWENIKQHLQNEQIFFVFLIITASFGSFILGRYSISPDAPNQKPQIIITHGAFSVMSDSNSQATEGELSLLQSNDEYKNVSQSTTDQYVASKSGKRYHHLTCPGAKQIKNENKIFFSTTQAAEAAGYTRAANCSR
jgi:hypothetical protein